MKMKKYSSRKLKNKYEFKFADYLCINEGFTYVWGNVTTW